MQRVSKRGAEASSLVLPAHLCCLHQLIKAPNVPPQVHRPAWELLFLFSCFAWGPLLVVRIYQVPPVCVLSGLDDFASRGHEASRLQTLDGGCSRARWQCACVLWREGAPPQERCGADSSGLRKRWWRRERLRCHWPGHPGS